MYTPSLIPLEMISSHKLRANLRLYLDTVQMRGSRFSIVRRGREVAGIVPIHEARALYEVDRVSEAERRRLYERRLDRDRALRQAMAEEMRKSGF